MIGITDRTRKALEKVGLTGYDIKIYTSLLDLSGQTASDLSQKSGVPYSKVYEVLGTLEDRGWIGSDDSRPTKYTARSPATCLETTRQAKDAEFAKNSAVITSELSPLYEKSGASEKPEIWVLTGAVNIASKILDMVESCRQEVMITIPEAGEQLVRQSLPKLRLLHDRGVGITVLTSDRMDSESIRAIKRVATVKIREGLFGGGIISDSRYVVILLGPDVGRTEGANGTRPDVVAIWADHAGLAGFARQYFEYLLKDSRKV